MNTRFKKAAIIAVPATSAALLVSLHAPATTNTPPISEQNKPKLHLGQVSAPIYTNGTHHQNGAELEHGNEAAAAKTKHYKFEYVDNQGRRARWNPCVPITWKYNPNGGAKRGLQNTKTAFKKLANKSGLKFKYTGYTKAKPFAKKHPNNTDIVIGWGNGKTHKQLAPQGVAGYGGFQYGYWRYPSGKLGAPEIMRGDVVLHKNRTLKKGYRKGGNSQGVLILHELGHAVGLAHVNKPNQVMNAVLQKQSPADYAYWDKQGLKKVGKQPGCMANPIRK